MALFKAYNGPSPTTASQAKVSTGTAIITLLQLATPAGATIKIREWGIDFDGFAAALPGQVELLQTDVAATVTAHVAAGVFPLQDYTPRVSILTLGTSATGYTGSAEGSITATRVFDARLIAPTSQYIYQFAQGTEPVVAPSKFLRIRAKFGTTIGATCYVVWEE